MGAPGATVAVAGTVRVCISPHTAAAGVRRSAAIGGRRAAL